MKHKQPEAKLLGKTVSYPKTYDPSVLVAVPRIENRRTIGLNNDQKIFTGVDVWHAYEVSFLLENGAPVSGLLKLVYPSSSENIVESKSLKLYLNSFNMHRISGTMESAINEFTATVAKDLAKIITIKPQLHFHMQDSSDDSDFIGYTNLESTINLQELKVVTYTENPDLLRANATQPNIIRVYSDALRSNCKVTFQPDWGSVFIHAKTENAIDQEALLKYIISFRNENHFHEEICETIYTRLHQKFKPAELAVSCIYTRRGGIDICPVRASKNELLPVTLVDHTKLSKKLLRQ